MRFRCSIIVLLAFAGWASRQRTSYFHSAQPGRRPNEGHQSKGAPFVCAASRRYGQSSALGGWPGGQMLHSATHLALRSNRRGEPEYEAVVTCAAIAQSVPCGPRRRQRGAEYRDSFFMNLIASGVLQVSARASKRSRETRAASVCGLLYAIKLVAVRAHLESSRSKKPNIYSAKTTPAVVWTAAVHPLQSAPKSTKGGVVCLPKDSRTSSTSQSAVGTALLVSAALGKNLDLSSKGLLLQRLSLIARYSRTGRLTGEARLLLG